MIDCHNLFINNLKKIKLTVIVADACSTQTMTVNSA